MKRKTFNHLPENAEKSPIVTMIMLVLVFISTGSAMMPGEMQKDQSFAEKKLRLLEMLERGDKLSSEEIRSTFAYDHFCNEPFMPVPGEFNEMMIDLGNEMEKIGRNLEDFHNSVEFKKEMERFSREREQLKIDLEKVKEEIKRAIKEIHDSGFEIEKV
jgi:uncharacterized coiled-coil DUF342 family protein